MSQALKLARIALNEGDWPVGAIITQNNRVVATGRGRQFTSEDPTAHAETDALADARRSGVDLQGATIYCTMEPCPMCAHALHISGISRVVLGARHADLARNDLGSYSLEKLVDMMEYEYTIVNDVERESCIHLRKEWGKDPINALK